jgi:cobalamin biosynthesis protein CbiG
MGDKVQEFVALKKEVEKYKSAFVKAGAEKSAGQSALTEKMQKVEKEFGVKTVEELAALVSSTESQLDAELIEVRGILEQVKQLG